MKNKSCGVDIAFDHSGQLHVHVHVHASIYKTTGRKCPSGFVLCTWPVTPSGIYGTLLLLLMLPMTATKKTLKTLFMFTGMKLINYLQGCCLTGARQPGPGCSKAG